MVLSYRTTTGQAVGQKVTPLDRVGHLRAGRQRPTRRAVLMNADPGAGGQASARSSWRWRRRRHAADVGPAAGGRCGRHPLVPAGGPPGRRRIALLRSAARRRWHMASGSTAGGYGQRAARVDKRSPGPGNSRWPSRPPSAASSGTVGIDIRDRRPERDPRAWPTGLTPADRPRDGSVQPGRARRAGPEHPGSCPDAAHHRRRRARARSTGCCRPCRRRAATSSAPALRAGAHPCTHSQHGGPACAVGQPHRAPEHLEAQQREDSRSLGAARCATPAPSLPGPGRSESLATTAPARTMLPPPATGLFLQPAGGLRLPEAQQPDRGQRRRACRTGAGRRKLAWLARAVDATRGLPRCGRKPAMRSAGAACWCWLPGVRFRDEPE